jgi:allene oxide cyclase-like protein
MQRWRKKRIFIGALAVAAVAVSVSVVSATTAGGATGSTVIHLIATEQNHQVLNQGKGSGLGDEAIFSGSLQYPGSDSVIGQFGGTLTQITPDGLLQANLTIQLPDGQIAVQGVLDFAKPPYVHAITGGTGAYDGVGGEFTFTHVSDNVLAMTLTLDR